MKAEFSGAKLAASYAATSALAQTSTNDIRAAGCMALTIVNNPSRRTQDFGLRLQCGWSSFVSRAALLTLIFPWLRK